MSRINSMNKILKCCGETPDIFDFTFEYMTMDIRVFTRYIFQCKKCGHHVHSNEDVEDVIPIWNRSVRRIL